MNLGEMRQEVIDILLEHVTVKQERWPNWTTRVNRWINWTIEQVAKQYAFHELRTSTTETTVSGTKQYDLPTNLKDIGGIFLDDTTQSRKLSRLHFRDYLRRIDYADDNQGRPNFYIKRGRKYLLHPVPDGTYTLILYYIMWPSTLTNDGDTTVLREKDQLIVSGAAAMGFDALMGDGAENAASKYWRKFNKLLYDAISNDEPDEDWMPIAYGFDAQGLVSQNPDHTNPWYRR